MKKHIKEKLIYDLNILDKHPASLAVEKDYSSLVAFVSGLFTGLTILIEKDFDLLFKIFFQSGYSIKYDNMDWSGIILHGLAENDKSKAWDIFFENIYDFIDQLPEED